MPFLLQRQLANRDRRQQCRIVTTLIALLVESTSLAQKEAIFRRDGRAELSLPLRVLRL
jgi:hypothetical protein